MVLSTAVETVGFFSKMQSVFMIGQSFSSEFRRARLFLCVHSETLVCLSASELDSEEGVEFGLECGEGGWWKELCLVEGLEEAEAEAAD